MQTDRTHPRLAALFLAAAMLTACGGGGGGSDTTTAPAPAPACNPATYAGAGYFR